MQSLPRIRVLPPQFTTVGLLPLLVPSSYSSFYALLLHQLPFRRMRSFDLLPIPEPPSFVRCFSLIDAISGTTSLAVLASLLLHVQPLYGAPVRENPDGRAAFYCDSSMLMFSPIGQRR